MKTIKHNEPIDYFTYLGWHEVEKASKLSVHPDEDHNWILCIDDEIEICEAIKIRLELEGYRVLRASNAMEGYRYAYDFLPQVILLDYNMPHVNGEQFLLSLKSNPVTAAIKVIFISGTCDIVDEKRFTSIGAAALSHKPIQYDRLVSLIARICEGQSLDNR